MQTTNKPQTLHNIHFVYFTVLNSEITLKLTMKLQKMSKLLLYIRDSMSHVKIGTTPFQILAISSVLSNLNPCNTDNKAKILFLLTFLLNLM